MSETPRKTQFAGFARLLLEDLRETGEVYLDTGNPHWRAEWEERIAERAYDFVVHIAFSTSFIATLEECRAKVALVPDLTEWPEEAGA